MGGRLIRVESGRISYVSLRAALVAQDVGVSLQVGVPVETGPLRKVTDRMAAVLCEAAGLLPETLLCRGGETREATPMQLERPADCVSFSGGVADYVYHPASDWFRHGDIGLLLADSIRRSALFTARRMIPPSGASPSLRLVVYSPWRRAHSPMRPPVPAMEAAVAMAAPSAPRPARGTVKPRNSPVG